MISPARPVLESIWLTVDGRRMYARVARSDTAASPVVLVHGLGVSSCYWVPAARLLAEDFSVFAPDLPGFGRSERPPRALNVKESADALLAWMDAAGLERAALVGNSLGCQVLVDAAVRFPSRVTRGVLVAPTIDARARSVTRQLYRLLHDVYRESPSLAAVVAWDYLRAGPVRLWRTLQAALQDRIETKLPHVSCPLLVVRGGRDPVVPQAWAEEVARLAPDARLLVIPHGAHAAHYSTAADLAHAVRPFLKEGRNE